MGNNYKHLTYNDRLVIERMINQGKFSKQDIASAIGCSVRTIYYEIKRATYEHLNSDYTTEERYSPEEAEKLYRHNLSMKGREACLKGNSKLKNHISYMIKKHKYSPGAVLLEMEKSKVKFDLVVKSVNTIYNSIRKGYFNDISMEALPRRGMQKKKKKNIKVQKRAKRDRGVSIEKRNEEILSRNSFGHWEMDCVIGKQTNKKALLVLTERKTRYEIIEVLKRHNSYEVVKAMNRLEKTYKSDFFKIFKTITVDNGCEFQDYKGIEKALYRVGNRTKLYYCHPHCPHERGSNENNNILIRRFFPKGTDFDKFLNKRDVKYIEEWINFYPRKMFDGKCSYELYDKELEKLDCKIQL